MKKLGALLLVVGGLVHLIPALSDWLSELTGGTAWLQMIVGAVSVVVGIALLMAGEKKVPQQPPTTQM